MQGPARRMFADMGMPQSAGARGHVVVKPDPRLPTKELRNGGIVRSERDGTAYVVSNKPVIHDWHQGTYTHAHKRVKGKANVKAMKRARQAERRRISNGK